jgi:hypothetical protein
MASPFTTTYDTAVDAISSSKYQWNSGTRALSIYPTLIDLTPTETKLLSLLREDSVKSASPEWERRTLAAPSETNAQPEGSDYTYVDPNIPTRVQNVTHIFRQTVEVSGTSMWDAQLPPIGTQKEYQLDTRMKEHKRDINWALYNDRLLNTNEATARHFRGIRQSIFGGGNTSNGGGVALVATGSAVSLKDGMLRQVWADGYTPRIIVTPASQQLTMDGFAFASTNAVNIMAEDFKRVSWVREIVTPFCENTRIYVERDAFWALAADITGGTSGDAEATYLAGTWMFTLDPEHWCIGWGRKTFMEEPAKDGDRYRAVIMSELTMKDYAATAGALIYNLAA